MFFVSKIASYDYEIEKFNLFGERNIVWNKITHGHREN